MESRRAAIDPDEVLDKSPEEISVADLLRALNDPKMVRASLIPVLLADKKKRELWVEEGPIFGLPLREILERLRADKKKVELEFPINWWEWVIRPELDQTRLVENIAEAVEKRIAERS